MSLDSLSGLWRSTQEGAELAGIAPEAVRELLRGLEASLGGTAHEAAFPYDLGEELGRGGMGVVFRAYDRRLRRTVALKFAHASETGALRLARFLREARITGQLQHPGILPVHELGTTPDGRHFFAMPVVHGQRLDHVFQLAGEGRDGWSLVRALHVLVRVCETLAYAHQRRVIHRDLKPQNVMVGAFGETYVMDWGLARILDEREPPDELGAGDPAPDLGEDALLRTQQGRVIGSPCYLAPEQAAGAELDVRVDVYSLGAMLYTLLAARPPYGEESSTTAAFERVRAGPPRPLRALAPRAAPELVAIAERAMARDPLRRYASVVELGDDLRAFVEGRVVRAHRIGVAAQLEKWLLRNKVVAAWMAATGASVILGSCALAWFQTRARSEEFLASDALRLPALLREADELWPSVPERAGELALWLENAQALYDRRNVHRARARELRADLGSRAPDAEQRRELRTRAELAAGLEALPSTIASVRGRLDFAHSVRARSLEDPAVEQRWRAAVASIADRRECPAYGGLQLAPQLGLVPLGRDPRSGLWEFAHLETGAEPRRALDGTLEFLPACGLVLVLVPPGVCQMGAQAEAVDQDHYDPNCSSWEMPVNTVSLDAFFLSKFEMTQAQWLRVTGHAPSIYPGPLHPVESVSWTEGRRTLERLGLSLPSEAQWEHAARAGTHTIFWTGDDPSSLGQYCAANLMDLSGWVGFEEQRTFPIEHVDWIDDGHVHHAPVGTFAANPFGLHDVLGNVWEWCEDRLSPYEVPARTGDGLRSEGEPGQQPVERGGSFRNSYASLRASTRENNAPDVRMGYLGLRPARKLDP